MYIAQGFYARLTKFIQVFVLSVSSHLLIWYPRNLLPKRLRSERTLQTQTNLLAAKTLLREMCTAKLHKPVVRVSIHISSTILLFVVTSSTCLLVTIHFGPFSAEVMAGWLGLCFIKHKTYLRRSVSLCKDVFEVLWNRGLNQVT